MNSSKQDLSGLPSKNFVLRVSYGFAHFSPTECLYTPEMTDVTKA